jgi:hypothetical protein
MRKASRMLAATLVLVGATGCGSGGSSQNDRPAVRERGGETTAPESAIDTVRDAIETSSEANTARYLGSFFFDAGPLGTDDPAAGSASLQDRTARYVVDMQAETEGLVPEGTPSAEVRLEVRDLGDELYLRFPAAFESAGVGDAWVRMPAVAEPTGENVPPGFEAVSGRVFLAARLLRPQTCFDLLQTATTAREIGPETVRDKETTRYALQWAPRQWVEDTGLFFFFGDDRSPERLATLDNVLAEAAIADVWIDDLGRVRRIVASADLTLIAPYFVQAGDTSMWRDLRTSCEFFDYGAEIPEVSVPDNVVTRGAGG